MTLSERVEARFNEIEQVARSALKPRPPGTEGFNPDDALLLAVWITPEWFLNVLLLSWRKRWEWHQPSDYGRTACFHGDVRRLYDICPDAVAVCREIGVPVDGDQA